MAVLTQRTLNEGLRTIACRLGQGQGGFDLVRCCLPWEILIRSSSGAHYREAACSGAEEPHHYET